MCPKDTDNPAWKIANARQRRTDRGNTKSIKIECLTLCMLVKFQQNTFWKNFLIFLENMIRHFMQIVP